MATHSRLDRNTMLAARQGLVPVVGGGWLGGFGNMFSKEMGDWFATRRWITRTLLWLAIINGMMAFIMFAVPVIDPSESPGLEEQLSQGLGVYFNFSTVFGAVGMIILALDEIIQERQTGTAAWILSKPVSRQSFILTKLLSNFLGGLIFIVAIPGAVAYAELYLLTRQALPVLPFLAGIGVIVLMLTFYLSLVIMLGTIFEQRGRVLGMGLGLVFGGLIASEMVQLVSYFLPVKMADIATALVQGQALPAIAISEIIATCVWSLLFIIVAVRRFMQLEF
jgi:ABC-2 type transport system permease protein